MRRCAAAITGEAALEPALATARPACDAGVVPTSDK